LLDRTSEPAEIHPALLGWTLATMIVLAAVFGRR